MSAQHGPGILVATDEGLHLVEATGGVRVDELAGRAVPALAADGDRRWAIADGKELWGSAGGARWSLVAKVPRRKATCLWVTARERRAGCSLLPGGRGRRGRRAPQRVRRASRPPGRPLSSPARGRRGLRALPWRIAGVVPRQRGHRLSRRPRPHRGPRLGRR